MNISLVTIAYNGYGQFLKQWCTFVSEMTIKPTKCVVVLGERHGATPKMIDECLEILPELVIILDKSSAATMGAYRNKAIEATDTEWVQYLSIDDKIMPDAIEHYKKYEEDADYLSVSWVSVTTWTSEEDKHHNAVTPEIMAKHNAKGFIVGHSPFRRWLWEKAPYEDHDYINYPFLAECIKNHARFVAIPEVCTVYLRRPNSHARNVLPRRREKIQAVYQKNKLQRVIRKYYGE